MDFQAVPPPSQYGAPNVFQQQKPAQGQAQGQQPGQPQQQNPISALLAKAKQLLSSGQISPDQYNQVAQQAQQSGNASLQYSGGNMGSGMPGAVSGGTGAPMNILPGAGG